MPKIRTLRRLLLPCFSPSTSSSMPDPSSACVSHKKRLSTSLPDDCAVVKSHFEVEDEEEEEEPRVPPVPLAPPRPSRTMVVGTIFGGKGSSGHMWFCIQQERLSVKPLLLLELSAPTRYLVKEMSFGFVRVALESNHAEFRSLPLRSIPFWSMTINGKRAGSAFRRKCNRKTSLLLSCMQNMTSGAGVIPPQGDDEAEIMYMRTTYEHVIAGPDVESFHMLNPEILSGPGSESGQELSIFLKRS